MSKADDEALGELLEHLKRARGFDFSGYKPTSLRRRIESRMRAVGAADHGAYIEHLELNPGEFDLLFDTILINVTGFFRDAPLWQHLQDEVLPAHLAALDPEAPIRVWSAGCASGEEAYSLAIVLAELLGAEPFRQRVKIYGTDVDEDALQQARTAVYTERAVASVPGPILDGYFDQVDGRYSFRPDLRRSVIFGRLDLLRDAPISRLDVLACRNTLMYLNAETQVSVLDRFRFALNDGGVLVLGKAETLLSNNPSFEAIDRKRRIFRKVAVPGMVPRGDRPGPPAVRIADLGHALERAALETSPLATLVVDADGVLVMASQRARVEFGLAIDEAAPLLRDLQISFRPAELRGPIERALTEREQTTIRSVSWESRGGAVSFDVTITPLVVDGQVVGTAVVFVDVTQQRELEDQLRRSNQELEHAYEELQSTNEELETTNEELQSTVEELETTNEELQSTNEELETMNEELQSTNEELHGVNEELRVRNDEVDQLNHFLEAILAVQRGGVAVVDGERRVRVWNARAQDLWGVREDEVRGEDLLSLDIGLPVEQIGPALDACLDEGLTPDDLTVAAVTRRGRAVDCRVSISPLRRRDVVSGAMVLMLVTEG